MANLADVLQQLGTTNRNVGGGGLMGLVQPQPLPAPQGVGLPSMPNPTPSVPTDVHGLPMLPPLAGQAPQNEPQLTSGSLPSWPEAAWAGVRRIAPQTMEIQQGIRSGLGNLIAQGGPGVMAAQRYGGGTWKEGLAKAGEDFDGIMGAIVSEPKRLATTYGDSAAAKQKLATDPYGLAMDLGYVAGPAEGLGRLALGRTADEFMMQGLRNTAIRPPTVQGMLSQQPGQAPGMVAPNVEGIGVIPRVKAQQMADPRYDLATNDAPSLGYSQMPPLQEPPPSTIGGVLDAQERMQQFVGISQPKSLGQASMPPLEEPVAFDTMGRHLQAQDKELNLWNGQSKIAHLNRFDPLQQPPPANTIQRVLAEQDKLGGTQAQSLPNYLQGRPPEPGPLDVEKHAGVLHMRGTPTLDTATVDMANTRLQEEIRLLKERRAYATNKHDRKWYDERIQKMQDAQATPEATVDNWSGGMYGFARTAHPSQTEIPFRRYRYTDPHPREDFGESGVGKGPGTYVKTGDQGKHWEWQQDQPPGPPGSGTVADQMGENWSFGQPLKWTATGGDGDPRGWRLTIDRNGRGMPIGRPRPAPAAPRRADQPVTEPGGQLRMPGVKERYAPYVPPDEHAAAAHDVNEAMDKIAQWERKFGNREMARKLEGAVIEARNAREAALRQPPPLPLEQMPEAQGILGMDPARRPHPDAAIFGRPGASQFARPPGEGTYVNAPGVPKDIVNDAVAKIAKWEKLGGDFNVALKMREAAYKAGQGGDKIVWQPKQPEGVLDQPTPKTVSDSNQFKMFGLPKNLTPWNPVEATTFETIAPDQPWKDYLDPKKHPNNAIRLNQEPGAEPNVNAAFKVGYEGDLTDPYFYKNTDKYGNAKLEVGAMKVGRLLGGDFLPAVMPGPTEMVTPWIEGPTLRSNPNLAISIIKRMEPAKRDLQLLTEFLIADKDKHPGNWILDDAGNRIIGIDYGGALEGNHRSMYHPPGMGNINAWYRLVREHVAKTTPFDKAVITDMIAQQPEVMKIFKDYGANQMHLDKLRIRYDKLKSLDFRDAPTYQDLHDIIDSN